MSGFHHHHHDDHHPVVSSYNRAFLIASLCNLLFVVIQIFSGIYADSMSLIADAIHNLGDVTGLLLAWAASWLATRYSASQRYSYGYKRTTILAAITNGLLLVGSSAIIGYESILNLFEPTNVKEPIIISVALLGTFVNGLTALFFMKDRHKDLNIRGAYLHLIADAAFSIGVAISGAIIWLTGWQWIDPIVGLLLVVLISYNTWKLLRDAVNLILDAVPQNIDVKAVQHYLATLTGVTEVHDLHIWGLSTTDTALTAHLIMPYSHLNDDDLGHIHETLRNKFNIGHVTLQIERGNSNYRCQQLKQC